MTEHILTMQAKAMAGPLRVLGQAFNLELLLALAGGPCSVSDLASRLELEISAISQRLGRLREAGLVGFERKGHRRLYALTGTLAITPAEGALSLKMDSSFFRLELTLGDSVGRQHPDVASRNTFVNGRQVARLNS
jgi:DNA-binding transcriptional ArsR family regulator